MSTPMEVQGLSSAVMSHKLGLLTQFSAMIPGKMFLLGTSPHAVPSACATAASPGAAGTHEASQNNPKQGKQREHCDSLVALCVPWTPFVI